MLKVQRYGQLLVIPTGLEPVAYRLGICRSIHLSYGTMVASLQKVAGEAKGGGGDCGFGTGVPVSLPGLQTPLPG